MQENKIIEESTTEPESVKAYTEFMEGFYPSDHPFFLNHEKWNKGFEQLTEDIFKFAWKEGYEAALKKHEKTIKNAPRLHEISMERAKALRDIYNHPETPLTIKNLCPTWRGRGD